MRDVAHAENRQLLLLSATRSTVSRWFRRRYLHHGTGFREHPHNSRWLLALSLKVSNTPRPDKRLGKLDAMYYIRSVCKRLDGSLNQTPFSLELQPNTRTRIHGTQAHTS